MYFSDCLVSECLRSRSFCLAVFCGFLLAVVLFSRRYCWRNTSSQRFITSEKHFSILNSLFFSFSFFFSAGTFPAARKTSPSDVNSFVFFLFSPSLRKHPLSHLYVFIAYQIHLFHLKNMILDQNLQWKVCKYRGRKPTLSKKKKPVHPANCLQPSSFKKRQNKQQ